MSGSGHDDHGDGHGAGEIPETLDAVVALIDHDKIYEQYLMMSGNI